MFDFISILYVSQMLVSIQLTTYPNPAWPKADVSQSLRMPMWIVSLQPQMDGWSCCVLRSLKLNSTRKWMVRILVSFWDGLFSDIFRGYVSFREGKSSMNFGYPKNPSDPFPKIRQIDGRNIPSHLHRS